MKSEGSTLLSLGLLKVRQDVGRTWAERGQDMDRTWAGHGQDMGKLS
ncbi:MAG: hypothetical protein J6Y90_03150 [Lachnospiraceae bacterium]|nr:hypothetical protein [Lachnospiraceae bacterium]